MIQPGQIEPGKAYLIKGSDLRDLLDREVQTNTDHIALKKDGNKTVLSFANERLVFYIANGVPAAAFVPMREAAGLS